MHRLRRDHGDAGIERGGAQALLQDGFGFGELRLGIDPAHVVLPGFDRDGVEPHLAGDRDGVGQVEFAFGVVVADAVEDRERHVAAQRHQAGVAERDGALGRARVLVLADRHQRFALHDQPAVAGRIGRPEAEHRHRLAVRERRAQAGSVCGRISGVSANRTRTSSAPASIAARAASTAWAVPRRSACTKIAAPGSAAVTARPPPRPARAPPPRLSCRRLSIAAVAHARAACVRRWRAAPSAWRSACGCLRRPPARSQGRFVAASCFRSRNCHPNAHARARSALPANASVLTRSRHTMKASIAGFC